MVDKNKEATQLDERSDESAVALTEKQLASLYKKSKKSGYSLETLEEVYNRGLSSWDESTNQTPEQYGFGRVNSFIAGGYAMELDEDLLNESTTALKKKAKKSGIPLSILRQVYKRGVAAWRTGHRPGTTPQQWALARVNSFITKGSGTWGKADKDLAAKARKAKKKVNEEAEMIAEAMVAKYRTGDARTDARREKHFDRGTAMNDDNPEAYRDAPGDKEARERGIPESEHTKRYRRMYGEEHCDCPDCMAERQSTNPDDSSSRFEGTNSLVGIYKAMTPGQSNTFRAIKDVVRDVRESEELSEKATSRVQQRLMGAALAHKRGETKSTSAQVRRLARTMTEKELEDFARTKHKGLPERVEEETLQEATYKGKKVKLNKPFRTSGGKKKFAVYVDPDGDGKAQIVRFGDPNMSIKKNQPARKKSYCARSRGIGKLNDKTSANYWSRKMWDC